MRHEDTTGTGSVVQTYSQRGVKGLAYWVLMGVIKFTVAYLRGMIAMIILQLITYEHANVGWKHGAEAYASLARD